LTKSILKNKTSGGSSDPRAYILSLEGPFLLASLRRGLFVGAQEIHSLLLTLSPCQLLGGRARGAAMLGVFLLSAMVHEYIFCFVLGFFYPVMLMLFLVIGGELGFCATGGESSRGSRPRSCSWGS
jgi:hypothetical protein